MASAGNRSLGRSVEECFNNAGNASFPNILVNSQTHSPENQRPRYKDGPSNNYCNPLLTSFGWDPIFGSLDEPQDSIWQSNNWTLNDSHSIDRSYQAHSTPRSAVGLVGRTDSDGSTLWGANSTPVSKRITVNNHYFPAVNLPVSTSENGSSDSSLNAFRLGSEGRAIRARQQYSGPHVSTPGSYGGRLSSGIGSLDTSSFGSSPHLAENFSIAPQRYTGDTAANNPYNVYDRNDVLQGHWSNSHFQTAHRNTFQSNTYTPAQSRDSHPSDEGFDSAISNAIDLAAKSHKSAAAVSPAACTWTGVLPDRNMTGASYSNKVFLGGVPWDMTPELLQHGFKNFGLVKIEFPKSDRDAPRGRAVSGSSSSHCTGYAYAIFENEEAVIRMLQSCERDPKDDTFFFSLPCKKITKQIQVIPWNVNDSNHWCSSANMCVHNGHTAFVGALHGILTAEGLAHVMNDLFGNVVHAGIDNDKYKYPIGSGRVTFSCWTSYMKAIDAAVVEIKSTKFAKKIQIDPYLEEQLCNRCQSCIGPYFCKNQTCFTYYCNRCWAKVHSGMNDSTGSHVIMARTPRHPSASSLRKTREFRAMQVGLSIDSLSDSTGLLRI